VDRGVQSGATALLDHCFHHSDQLLPGPAQQGDREGHRLGDPLEPLLHGRAIRRGVRLPFQLASNGSPAGTDPPMPSRCLTSSAMPTNAAIMPLDLPHAGGHDPAGRFHGDCKMSSRDHSERSISSQFRSIVESVRNRLRFYKKRLPERYADFDPVFYLNTNPDVAASGLDPYAHYAHYGHAEGRARNAQVTDLFF
jgi:hypothetical protein